ncbi:histone-like nucleoid-structuring protein Lsr2 [Actinomyces trachealis]|uniref:histone-like nucleoid-structuring protein Lsr2 n=1 Tax=Actinomyces trachealis TaxID=2763540 RepID=UPI001892AE33|nr:Lsr2 family protein [Actinomyces trachealis]
MARKTIQMLVDDIDGSEATQTVTFGLDGATYEIDLNDKHAAALRESLEEWVVKGHRVAGRVNRRRGAGAARPGNAVENQRIRDWARANGREVSDRGRISAEIREAYAAAHS